MPEEIRCCFECSLQARSFVDAQWQCNHPKVRREGRFINITGLEGCPYRQSVSRQCPLQDEPLHLKLADDVTFID